MVGIIAALPLEGLHWGAGDTERIKMKRGLYKVTWTTLRGECFHCAQAPNKRQNEEKKNQFYFLPGWSKKKTEEKRNDDLLNLRTMKSNAVCNFEFIISHCETGLCLQRKKRRHRLKSKLNQQTVQKKRTFECAGRFSDFFIKKERKQSLEKTGCLPLILSYIIFILFIIWVVF